MTTCSRTAPSYNGAEQVMVTTSPQSSSHASIPTIGWSQSESLATSSRLRQLQHPAVKWSWFVIFPASFAQANSMGQPAGKDTRVSLSHWHPLPQPCCAGHPHDLHSTSWTLLHLRHAFWRLASRPIDRLVAAARCVRKCGWPLVSHFLSPFTHTCSLKEQPLICFASSLASSLGLGTSASFPTNFDCWKPSGSYEGLA